MKMSIDISGARQLDDMLKQLPVNIARRAAGNALRAGARVIRDQAKINAPVGPQESLGGANQPGQLRRAIKVITGKSSQANRRRVLVIVTNADAGINPHWIEFGTGPRIAKSGGFLYFVIDGKLIRKKSVAGITGTGFMRRAADAKVGAAVDVIGQSLGKAIEKEAVKLGGGGRIKRR